MLYLADYNKDSISEGEGLRNVIYISGCLHRCPDCFSPETHAFDYGIPFTRERQARVIQDLQNPLIDGLTLCGGDCFFSPVDTARFVAKVRQVCPNKTVWAYTGFTYEELLQDSDRLDLLLLLDVVIDGKFQKDKRDVSLPYRGSSNQRIINVEESLKKGIAIEWTL